MTERSGGINDQCEANKYGSCGGNPKKLIKKNVMLNNFQNTKKDYLLMADSRSPMTIKVKPKHFCKYTWRGKLNRVNNIITSYNFKL